MQIKIKVLPRSSKNSIELQPDGSYRIKITAAPVDGEANKKLLTLLSKEFDIAKSRLKIIKGETGKEKIIEISD